MVREPKAILTRDDFVEQIEEFLADSANLYIREEDEHGFSKFLASMTVLVEEISHFIPSCEDRNEAYKKAMTKKRLMEANIAAQKAELAHLNATLENTYGKDEEDINPEDLLSDEYLGSSAFMFGDEIDEAARNAGVLGLGDPGSEDALQYQDESYYDDTVEIDYDDNDEFIMQKRDELGIETDDDISKRFKSRNAGVFDEEEYDEGFDDATESEKPPEMETDVHAGDLFDFSSDEDVDDVPSDDERAPFAFADEDDEYGDAIEDDDAIFSYDEVVSDSNGSEEDDEALVSPEDDGDPEIDALLSSIFEAENTGDDDGGTDNKTEKDDGFVPDTYDDDGSDDDFWEIM